MIEGRHPRRFRRRVAALALWLLVLAAVWAAAQSATLVEHAYARRAGANLARAISVATGVVPFCVAEFALAGVAFYLLLPLVTTVVQIIRRRRAVVEAASSGLLRVLVLAAFVTAAFYVTWGLNYARAPLPDRLGWQPIERPADEPARRRQAEEILTLTRQLVEATNDAYREFAGGDDLGRPSSVPAGVATLDPALEAGYARVHARLALEPAIAWPRGRAKPAAASLVMSHLGLRGFYFPWTGEATYNRLQPEVSLPQVLAHEKAHQRGIAREDEASFVGYLACASSQDPYVRYSGYLFAQGQLLGELSLRAGPEAAAALRRQRLPGVQRDLAAVSAYWRRYAGRASRVSSRVNDRYIRAQGDRRGTAAYGASRSLIVLFARHNGGSAIVP